MTYFFRKRVFTAKTNLLLFGIEIAVIFCDFVPRDWEHTSGGHDLNIKIFVVK